MVARRAGSVGGHVPSTGRVRSRSPDGGPVPSRSRQCLSATCTCTAKRSARVEDGATRLALGDAAQIPFKTGSALLARALNMRCRRRSSSNGSHLPTPRSRSRHAVSMSPVEPIASSNPAMLSATKRPPETSERSDAALADPADHRHGVAQSQRCSIRAVLSGRTPAVPYVGTHNLMPSQTYGLARLETGDWHVRFGFNHHAI